MYLINIFRSNKNYLIALIITLSLMFWLFSGLLGQSQETEQGEEHGVTNLTRVQASRIQASNYLTQVVVRSRTAPNRQVDVRAEVEGRVVGLPVNKGQQVHKDAVICELAVEDRELRVTEANSNVHKAQLEYDGALRLKTGGYQSKTAIAAAKARLDTALAELQHRQMDLDNRIIRAPFTGVVDRRPVEMGDFVRVGDVCAQVVDLDPLLIVGQVSETEVGDIRTTAPAQASLITGEEVSGSVRFVSRQADEVTRTFRVEVEVANAEGKLRAGITSELILPIGEISAHLVPATLLALDDTGGLGVKILDEDHRVAFAPVTLVGDDVQGVWVSGLPEQTVLVTVGQQYVTEGEKVAVVFEDEGSEGLGANGGAGL